MVAMNGGGKKKMRADPPHAEDPGLPPGGIPVMRVPMPMQAIALIIYNQIAASTWEKHGFATFTTAQYVEEYLASPWGSGCEELFQEDPTRARKHLLSIPHIEEVSPDVWRKRDDA